MNQPQSQTSNWIVETDQASFEQDVFERSKQVPVVVDFWAAWCGPCRALGPVLEKLATQFDGQFVLVKADTDQVPRAAAEFNVQSIPAVFAVVDGEVVDFFNGALPEPQIREWLDRVLAYGQLKEAKRLEDSDPQLAEKKYRELLQQSPNAAEASIGLARCLVAQDRNGEARELIENLESRGFLEPEAEAVKAALELHGEKDENLDELQSLARANPDDFGIQLRLTKALAANKRFEEALEAGLSLVQRDSADAREQARQLMVDIFRVAPDEDLVRTYRRKLSSALY